MKTIIEAIVLFLAILFTFALMRDFVIGITRAIHKENYMFEGFLLMIPSVLWAIFFYLCNL